MSEILTPASVTAVIGATVSALTYLASRRKVEAEVKRSNVDTASKVAEMVEQHYGAIVAQLRGEVEALRSQLTADRQRIAKLETALRVAGLPLPD